LREPWTYELPADSLEAMPGNGQGGCNANQWVDEKQVPCTYNPAEPFN